MGLIVTAAETLLVGPNRDAAALGDDPALLDILADLAAAPAADCIQLTPTEALT